MKEIYIKIISISVSLLVCSYLIIVELKVISSLLTDSLLFFYFLLPVTILLFIVGIIKLVNVIQYVKLDIVYYEKYNQIAKITSKTLIGLIGLGVILLLCYSAYQIHITSQYQNYDVFNSSNFTNYEENERTQYNMKFLDSTSLFGNYDTTVSKMVFIDDTKHQIIINGTYIKTQSTLFTNLKYYLMKNNLMKDKQYIEKDDYVYFYDKGRYDGIIKYSEIVVIAKGKSGFVCITVQTSTPNNPINVEKSIKYCQELVA